MTYADSNEVTRKIQKLETIATIDSDLLNDAISTGDDLVNAEVQDTSIPSTTPEAIEKAATLLASAEYLDGISTNAEVRNPTAIAWENKAYKLIHGWLAENQTSTPTGGYSRNNTSKHRPYRGNKLHSHPHGRFR